MKTLKQEETTNKQTKTVRYCFLRIFSHRRMTAPAIERGRHTHTEAQRERGGERERENRNTPIHQFSLKQTIKQTNIISLETSRWNTGQQVIDDIT